MRSISSHAWRHSFAALLSVLCCSALPGYAQEIEVTETVENRPRPDFDANGVRVGGMTLMPKVAGEFRYFDNVFADDEVETGDSAFILSPQVSLNSRSERHLARIGAKADLARYGDRDTENYDDARLWALARMELGAGEIEGELRLSRLHQERVSPDDLGCAQFAGDIVCTGLTEFNSNRAGIAYTYQPGRIMLRSDLRYTRIDYDDTELPLGSRSMSNDDRDRGRADLGLRLGYARSPEQTIYLETRFDSIEFEQIKDRDGFQRSSEGAEVRLGLLLEFSGSTFGEVYLGYLERDFADQRFETASGPTFGADISWNVTDLTTLSVEGERIIDNTIVIGASGISKSRLSLSADHELARNLVLNAELGIGRDEFENLDRDDHLAQFQLGGTYLMNRNLRLLFGYRYRTRDTSPASSGGRVFSGNDLFVRMVGQL